MNQIIKFSIIGLGNIGKRHLSIVAAEKRAKISSVCDIDKNLCNKYSTTYEIRGYTDYSILLAKSDADVISICTPHHLHAEMSIAAAEAGKHVLVEKPMALSSVDAERMIDAAKTNNTILIVMKQNRYNFPVLLTKKAIDENRLGKIFMVACNVYWNRNEEYYKKSDWRGIKQFEGGALYTQASHFIDLLIWLFGKVKNAKTIIDTKNHSIEIEDCGTSVLNFDSGIIGSLSWTTCTYNKNYEGSITIIGEKGTIKIGGQYLNKIEFWDVQSYPLQEGLEYVDKPNIYESYQGTSSNHDKVIADIISTLNKEDTSLVLGEEGIKTVRAIELMYQNTF